MITVVYSSPRFVFGDPSSFLGFVATILPQRFNSIRSIHIDQRCGDRSSPLLSFSSDLDYKAIRHLNIVASPFPNPSKKPENMHLLRMVCEILCEMKALNDLRLDFIYLKLTKNDYDVSKIQGVNCILSMFERQEFKTLDISFEQVPPEGTAWLNLPFVRLRSQPLCESSTVN